MASAKCRFLPTWQESTADRAMLIRGLPEMSIKDVHLSDVVIKSRRGAEVVEASGVSLRNISLQCSEGSPLINVENSHHLTFSKVQALTAPKQFFSVNGERSAHIQVDSVATSSVIFGYGAEKGAVTVGR